MTDFSDRMVELQQQIAIGFAKELTRLRAENAALRLQLESMPATASELQDRVTMLEQLLQAR